MSLYNDCNISACIITDGADLNKLFKAARSCFSSCKEIIICANKNFDEVRDSFRYYSKVKVYPQIWEKDFSKARNEVMSYAKGDWIFIIDSDEELETPIKYIDESIDVYNVLLVIDMNNANNITTGEHREARLFKNNKGFYYSGKIHEQLECGDATGTLCNVVIRQFPTHDKEAMKGKIFRNAEILLADKENKMQDFLLCQLFAELGKNEEAIYHAEKVIHGDYPAGHKSLAAFWSGRAFERKEGKVTDTVIQMMTLSILLEPQQILSRMHLADYLVDRKANNELIQKQYMAIKEVIEKHSSRLPIDFYLNLDFVNKKIMEYGNRS